MNSLSFLEIGMIGILISFGAFFIFWCKEITRMRGDLTATRVSMEHAVAILKEMDNRLT